MSIAARDDGFVVRLVPIDPDDIAIDDRLKPGLAEPDLTGRHGLAHRRPVFGPGIWPSGLT
ncbi:hypothetical protein ACFZ8E_15805 [Methylobacterium sp. HMF5984]|uniref:hypothetical protein n=1 Tax=Methylobacterium sp. HMF5984 TaxID=3367370 RepID=UPI003853BBFD